MGSLEDYTFEDLEKQGLCVNSVLHLIDWSDVGRAQLTTLVNTHDTGFDVSFTSTSSTQIKIQALLNNYGSDITVKDFLQIFTDQNKAAIFLNTLTLVFNSIRVSLSSSSTRTHSTPRMASATATGTSPQV